MGSITPPSYLRSKLQTSSIPIPWRETPLIESRALSAIAGCRIFLKLDNLQPSGSFKSRGVGNVVLQAVRAHRSSPDHAKPLHFYSSSGGNAGLAAVTAATSLSCQSSVVVPEGTDPVMISRIRAAGAHEVITAGSSWMYADQYLRETVIPSRTASGKEIGIHVPPFDHQDIWDGHATLIDEMAAQLSELDPEHPSPPDAIICSVGGGGLFCGVVQGAEKHGWIGHPSPPASPNAQTPHTPIPQTQILALETRGADSLSTALASGSLTTLPAITSLAKSLGAVRVASRAFDYAHSIHPTQITSAVLSDAEACMGSWRFADDERILVEPACGVSVAVAYIEGMLKGLMEKSGREFGRDSRVVVVVCGGSHVSLEKIQGWKEEFGELFGEGAGVRREGEAETEGQAEVVVNGH